MGKINSKQVCKRTAPEGECILVNTKVTSVKDLVDAINTNSSLTEAFVEVTGPENLPSSGGGAVSHNGQKIKLADFMECCVKPDSAGFLDPRLLNIPLRVTLPPLNKESDLLKILTVDQGKEEYSGSVKTDTTDNNCGSDKAEDVAQETRGGMMLGASSGPELQEWLFTLYDFDDLGKITKEDITGLLKSLYDTVGSVITLQQQGARVLKLHLTVSACDKPKNPDIAVGEEKLNRDCGQELTNVDDCVPTAFKSFPSGHAGGVTTKKISRPRCPPTSSRAHHGSPRTSNRKTVEAHGVREKKTEAGANTSGRKETAKDSRGLTITRRLSFSGGFREATVAGAAQSTSAHRRQLPSQQCNGASKRLSHFEERHLAQLIQQNVNIGDPPQPHSRKTRHHHNSILSKPQDFAANRNCVGECRAEESAQRRNYYLDLAGVENYSTINNCDRLSFDEPNVQVYEIDERCSRSQNLSKIKSRTSASKTKGCAHCKPCRTDAQNAANAIHEEEELCRAANAFVDSKQETRLLDFPAAALRKPSALAAHDIETVSSSHYHRRHRHREKNQSRAMKQVAEWIEKEHVYHKTEKRVVVVQRHEHHHIHEHIHHHIHHNDDT